MEQFSAVFPIKMKHCNAAQTAPSFVASSSSEARNSGISESNFLNSSHKASRMDIITHEQNQKRTFEQTSVWKHQILLILIVLLDSKKIKPSKICIG